MPSSKTRQRKLARAKMERQLARRAARARRNRQVQAGVAVGIVVVLAVIGTVWALGGFSPSKKTTTASTCEWNGADTASNTNLKDVGTPPTSGEPRTGTETMTINTNLGTISVALDLVKAPCTAASFAYLAGKHFFDNSTCHRLLTSGDYVLQCGDPTGTGQGGPGYTFADEYVPPAAPAPSPSASAGASPSASASADPSASPSTPPVIYPAGSLAMANSGADTNGSQFFIVYKDSPFPPSYTLFGTVTAGLDLVQQVGAAGDDGSYNPSPGGGKPKKAVTITSLTVSKPGETPSPAASPSPSASAGPSGSPSPSSKP